MFHTSHDIVQVVAPSFYQLHWLIAEKRQFICKQIASSKPHVITFITIVGNTSVHTQSLLSSIITAISSVMEASSLVPSPPHLIKNGKNLVHSTFQNKMYYPHQEFSKPPIPLWHVLCSFVCGYKSDEYVVTLIDFVEGTKPGGYRSRARGPEVFYWYNESYTKA